MTAALVMALRGFCQVGPVAASTYFIATGRVWHAAAASVLISVIWWTNAGTASHLAGMPWALYYGAGAGLGTLAGQFAARTLTQGHESKEHKP